MSTEILKLTTTARIHAATASVNSRRRELDSLTGRRDALLDQLATYTKEIEDARRDEATLIQVRTLLEKLTDSKRELVRTKIEALVTSGIQTVFGNDYQFRIEQTVQRNLVNFHYKIIHEFAGERHESDLRGHHGGGLVALVGFLLRVVMVLFTRPARRRLIVLDETMAALDGDKRAPFSKLLSTLSEQLDLQFIMVTHSEEYSTDADRTYEIKRRPDGGAALFDIT